MPHPIGSAGELDGAKVRCDVSIMGAIDCTRVPMINASKLVLHSEGHLKARDLQLDLDQ